MQNLVNVQGEIKAVASSCTGTPTAKLIALLEAAGITASAEIAAILGVAIRTVQHARRGTKNATHCAETQPIAAQPIAPDATHCAKAQPIAPPARVLDNNKLTSLEDSSKKNNNPPVGPPKPKTAKRGSRLPDDWELPEHWRQWVLVNCAGAMPSAVAVEALKFGNFWQSKAGKDACKLDWFKTWQNWCLKAFATGPTRHHNPVVRQPSGTSVAAIQARRRAAALEAVQ